MTAKKANATYTMDTKHTLSPAMAERIAKKFTEGRTKFSRLDFVDLAKKYKKASATISSVLYYMEGKNKIVAVGGIKRAGGGIPIKVYQVVSGSDFTDKYEPDYRARMANIEQRNNECGMRLHEVLNKIVRLNAARV